MNIKIWRVGFMSVLGICMYANIQCRIDTISQRVRSEDYPCVRHNCTMSDGSTQYLQEFNDAYVFQDGKIIIQEGVWCTIGHTSRWDVLPISIPSNVVFKEVPGTVAVLAAT